MKLQALKHSWSMSYREPPVRGWSPVHIRQHSPLENVEPAALYRWFEVGSGSDRQGFFYAVQKKTLRSQGGLWITCYYHLKQAPIFVPSPHLWSPLCCLMGSWPQGKGYTLSFLQLAFTVSLAELMHHIFEAQVPCVALSDCRVPVSISTRVMRCYWQIPWRKAFQGHYY